MPITGSSNVFLEEIQTSTIGDTIPTPPVGSLAIFSNQNGNWYAKNSSAVVTLIGSSVTTLQNTDGDITITNPSGPTVTINLTNQIAAGGPTGAANTVPVITYNNKGQLTAVTTATITPGAIGAQAAGNYITSLTGPITASGPGAVATTVVGPIPITTLGNLAANSVLGNPTGSAAVPVAMPITGTDTTNVVMSKNAVLQPRDIVGRVFVDGANSQGWAGADVGAWINAAYAYLITTYGTSFAGPPAGFTGGGIIEVGPLTAAQANYTTPIVCADQWFSVDIRGTGAGQSNSGSGRVGGTTLNYTPTTGIAMTLAGASNNAGGVRLSNINLQGAGSGNATTGIQWGLTAGGSPPPGASTAGATIQDVVIQGFGTGETWNAAPQIAYAVTHINVKVQNCNVGVAPAQENNVWFGGLIGSCATGMNCTSATECQLFGLAFDDQTANAIVINNALARISDLGCRYENPTIANPSTYVSLVAGSFSKYGGGFQDDNSTGTGTGFIQMTGGTLEVQGAWVWTAGRVMTQIVNVTGTTAQINKLDFVLSQNATLAEFPTLATAQGFLSRGPIAYLAAPVTSSGTASTETLAMAARIPGNSVRIGDTFRVTAGFSNVSTGTVILKLRVGAAGTVAGDAVALTLVTSGAQVASTWCWFDALVTVRSATTVMANGVGTATAVVLPMATAAPATATIASTAPWFIDITMTDSVASGLICETASVTLI